MIIEFAGLPKSGKSSSISVVRDYFSRYNYSVRLITEGARKCPFSNINRVEFACWAANQALNYVLESGLGDNKETIFVQDRGLFDALAFIKLLHIEDYIDEDTLFSLLAYFADIRWTKHVDMVILFTVSPDKAIERDIAATLNAPPGVITNKATMHKLSLAYDFVLSNYTNLFNRIVPLITTEIPLNDTIREVVKSIESLLPQP